MPPVNVDVGGYTAGAKHSATIRLQSPGLLDVVVEADGTTTVLDLVKAALAEMGNVVLPNPVPANWSELAVVPASGVEITLSIGVLVKHDDA